MGVVGYLHSNSSVRRILISPNLISPRARCWALLHWSSLILESLVRFPEPHVSKYQLQANFSPLRLQAMRQKVRLARATSPLFNIGTFAHHLGDLYLRIWDKRARGQPNDHITSTTQRTLPSDRLLCTEPLLEAVSPDEYMTRLMKQQQSVPAWKAAPNNF